MRQVETRDMNVIWSKDKSLNIFNNDTKNVPASGQGDAISVHCCRLCGGETSLRPFGDTYIWEGVEERYDQLLYNCFGVKAPTTDCMICEWCVRQLRNIERFKALVYAAFEKPIGSSNASQTKVPLEISSSNNKDTGDSDITNKGIIQLLKTKMITENPKKRFTQRKKRNAIINPNKEQKKANIQCSVCKQKYTMMVSTLDRNFICSRCKNNYDTRNISFKKCNAIMPTPTRLLKEHMGLKVNEDLRGKYRPTGLSKKPSQLKRSENTFKNAQKLLLGNENKKGDSQFLKDHNIRNTICPVCRKDVKTKERLNKHFITHIVSKKTSDKSNDLAKQRAMKTLYNV